MRKKPASCLLCWPLSNRVGDDSYEAVAITNFCLRPQHQTEKLLEWAAGYLPKQLERSKSGHVECAVVVILCLMLLSLVSLDKVIVLWYISSYILNGAMLYKKLNYQNFTMGKICGTDKYVV